MDKYISSARKVNLSLLLLGAVAFQTAWTEHEIQERIAAYQIYDLFTRVYTAIDKGTFKDIPTMNLSGNLLEGSEYHEFTLSAHPGRVCAFEVTRLPSDFCRATEFYQDALGANKVPNRILSFSPVLSWATLRSNCPAGPLPGRIRYIQDESTDSFFFATKEWKELLRQGGIYGANDHYMCSRSLGEGEFAAGEVIGGATLMTTIRRKLEGELGSAYVGTDVDRMFNLLFSRNESKPNVFGLTINAWFAIVAFPALFLGLAVAFLHRVRRIAASGTKELEEPWIMMHPEGVEKLVAVAWSLVTLLSGLPILWMIYLFGENKVVISVLMLITVTGWALLSLGMLKIYSFNRRLE